MKGTTGTFAGFGRWSQRHRADLEESWFKIFVPLCRRGFAGVAFVLFDIERRHHAFEHRFYGRAVIRTLGEERPNTDAFLHGGVPQNGVDIRIGMSAAGVHVVGPDNTYIMPVDQRAGGIFALEGPAAIAKEYRILSARGFSLRGILVDPLFALGKTVRRKRGIGLDPVVEQDADLDSSGLDRGVGPGLAGESCGRRGKACKGANQTYRASERECGGAQGKSFERSIIACS